MCRVTSRPHGAWVSRCRYFSWSGSRQRHGALDRQRPGELFPVARDALWPGRHTAPGNTTGGLWNCRNSDQGSLDVNNRAGNLYIRSEAVNNVPLGYSVVGDSTREKTPGRIGADIAGDHGRIAAAARSQLQTQSAFRARRTCAGRYQNCSNDGLGWWVGDGDASSKRQGRDAASASRPRAGSRPCRLS